MKSVGAYEAKTHLPRLLDEVSRGETITITRHGEPVAQLVPVTRRDRQKIREAIAGLRSLNAGNTLGGGTLRDLIDEGRRL